MNSLGSKKSLLTPNTFNSWLMIPILSRSPITNNCAWMLSGHCANKRTPCRVRLSNSLSLAHTVSSWATSKVGYLAPKPSTMARKVCSIRVIAAAPSCPWQLSFTASTKLLVVFPGADKTTANWSWAERSTKILATRSIVSILASEEPPNFITRINLSSKYQKHKKTRVG